VWKAFHDITPSNPNWFVFFLATSPCYSMGHVWPTFSYYR